MSQEVCFLKATWLRAIVAMFKQLKGAIEFLDKEEAILGDDAQGSGSANAQMKHFIDNLSTYDRNNDDAIKANDILMSDAAKKHFSKEQITKMARTISTHMKGSTSDPGSEYSQRHNFLYNYLSAKFWNNIWSDEFTRDQQMNMFVEFFIQIGLRFADDTTVKQALAILNCGIKDYVADPDQNYLDFHKLREKLRIKREMTHGEVTFKDFPEDVDEFITMYPDRIKNCVESRVQPEILKEMAHKRYMPTRKNNSSLTSTLPLPGGSQIVMAGGVGHGRAAQSGPRAKQQAAHGSNDLFTKLLAQQQQQAEMQQIMFRFMMGRPSAGDTFDNMFSSDRAEDVTDHHLVPFGRKSNASHGSPRSRGASSDALDSTQAKTPPSARRSAAQRYLQGTADDGNDGKPSSSPSNLKDIINAQIQAAKKGKKAANKGKKRKGSKESDAESEVEGGDDDAEGDSADGQNEDENDEEGDDEDVASEDVVVKKKPCANTKADVPKKKVGPPPKAAKKAGCKPKGGAKTAPTKATPSSSSAAQSKMKRPASAASSKKPPPSKSPTPYRGGKIYYSEKKLAFRVYKRAHDKVEATVGNVNWKKPQSLQRRWDAALELIDNDPRDH